MLPTTKLNLVRNYLTHFAFTKTLDELDFSTKVDTPDKEVW